MATYEYKNVHSIQVSSNDFTGAQGVELSEFNYQITMWVNIKITGHLHNNTPAS